MNLMDLQANKLEKIPKIEKKEKSVTITSPRKLKAAIIGCTGLAGQSIVDSLISHPWFEIFSLHGLGTVGLPYSKARRSATAKKIPKKIADIPVKSVENLDINEIDLVFSAIPSEQAALIESKLAKKVPVFSTASWARYQPDIPIFLPIVNGHHADLLRLQQQKNKSDGFICPGPNCTTVGLAVALYPIFKTFGLKNVTAVSMQAVSGAGYGGISSYDILGNIIPYIPEEEQKVRIELKKIFAKIPKLETNKELFSIPDFIVDVKCNRVPVLEGHMISVFFQTIKTATEIEIRKCLQDFQGTDDMTEIDRKSLLNYPKTPIIVFSSEYKDRPQPRIDLSSDNHGMTTFIGGLEPSNFNNGFKMTVLSHNTELGAGRGAVLNAEYLYLKKLFGRSKF